MTTATAPPSGGLLDLRGLSLADLLTVGSNPVLDAAILKVTEAAEEHPQKAVCAFNSAV